MVHSHGYVARVEWNHPIILGFRLGVAASNIGDTGEYVLQRVVKFAPLSHELLGKGESQKFGKELGILDEEKVPAPDVHVVRVEIGFVSRPVDDLSSFDVARHFLYIRIDNSA